jgi:hypothetical protein
VATNVREERPIGTAELVGEIIADAQTLIRQELDLAKAELKAEGHKAKIAFLAFGSASALAALGLFCFSLSVVFFLSTEASVPLWASFLIVTVAYAFAASALGFWAREHIYKLKVVPPKMAESIKDTTHSIKENVQWIRNQT